MSANELTEAEFTKWLTPRQALNVVQQALPDIGVASRTIVEHLRGAQVAAAVKASSSNKKRDSTGIVMIPSWHWDHVRTKDSDWWDTGVISFYFSGSTETIRCFGIRFKPSDINSIIADLPKRRVEKPAANPVPPRPAEQVQQPAPPSPSKGGRPRKDFWDDLLIAIFAQIYSGELIPKSQADLEKAMLNWASHHGHELGETSVKGPARKLFAVVKP